jgi:hypothetical protein
MREVYLTPEEWAEKSAHAVPDGPPIKGVVIMSLAEVGSANGPIIDTVTQLIRVLPR